MFIHNNVTIVYNRLKVERLWVEKKKFLLNDLKINISSSNEKLGLVLLERANVHVNSGKCSYQFNMHCRCIIKTHFGFNF